MHAEGGDLAVQAQHGRSNGLRLQVHAARLLGADPSFALGGHAVLPVDVQRLHALQADMQGAVDRCASALEDADHGEGFVVVLAQADGGHAMGQHQLLTQLIVQGLGHFGAEHHGKGVVGKGLALSQLQGLAAAVLIMFEVGAAGAHDPVATV